MSFVLQANSNSQVFLEPEYDFSKSTAKIENVHRTRAGSRYVYKWGEYTRFKFSLRFINSADMSTLNEWWSTNAQLEFYEEGTLDITSCQISNATLPIDKFIAPYMDRFKGKIELEEY
jgi:hypothetical protein